MADNFPLITLLGLLYLQICRSPCRRNTWREIMVRYFTLEYWADDGWYVGRLKEVPGVFSQGETLEELEENIEEAYRLMVEAEEPGPRPGVQTEEIGLEV
jgi:predicted RNase H-like HicB family nuclease